MEKRTGHAIFLLLNYLNAFYFACGHNHKQIIEVEIMISLGNFNASPGKRYLDNRFPLTPQTNPHSKNESNIFRNIPLLFNLFRVLTQFIVVSL